MIALSSNRPQARKDPHLIVGIVGAFGRSLTAAALLLCLPALALASAESELSFHRGVAAFGEGDRESARLRFEEVIREDPDNASALHYLGLIAIQNRDTQSAIDYLQRVVALTPDSAAARIDLGAQLLKTRRDEEALVQFDAVLERNPDHALALLYQGIALYRGKTYEDALDSLERAVELDGELSAEANYYIGLSETHLGDVNAAAAAFNTAASASPQHPLGRSASSLGKQAARAGRRWSLAATAGFEYNNNVRLSPDDITDLYQPDTAASGAAVARLQGQVEAYGNENLSWRVGYDGYLQIYTNTDKDDFGTAGRLSPYDLSQQTHVAWTNVTYSLEPVSLALRYDFSYTAIDLTESFRNIHRVAPTIYVPVSDWGLLLAYYQFLLYDYKYDYIKISNPEAFDRSGPQHSIGGQQFVFLPEPFKYTVIGALLTSFDSDGTEFRHNGVEVSAGGEMDLPWGLSASLLYRYAHRNYTEPSAVTSNPEPIKRRDNQHEISFNLDRTFLKRYNASLAGTYSHNSSNITQFDINRFIIGTYFRYSF
jgi:tetratricopeptide (TPR) repeat protein